MPRNDKCLSAVAEENGISYDEARKIVTSFFDSLRLDAKALPFDNATRVFSRDKFNEFVRVQSIPFIGRIGPVYSRYLCWRRNEAAGLGQEFKKSYKTESRKKRAELLAREILYGERHGDEKNDSKYRRVWIVKQNGKRLAKQVIPINEE